MKNIIVIMRWLRRGGAENNTVKIINQLSKDNNIKLFVISSEQPDLRKDLEEQVDVVLGCSWLNIFRYLAFHSGYNIIFCGDHRIAIYISVFCKIFFWRKNNLIFRCINNLTVLLDNKSRIQKYFLKRFLANVNGVIAQCEEMKSDLAKNWDIKSERIQVIYNSFSDLYNNVDLKDIHTRKESFLYVGRFSQQKRLDLMVESFLKANIPTSSTLTLVGFRPWMDEDNVIKSQIDNLSKKYNGHDKIIVIDWTDDSQNYMSKCGCFLLSSKFEGFPNVLIEAIAHGVPIVSSNCKFGPSEIVDEFNGILVESVTVESYSKAITSAYSKNWDHNLIMSRAEKFSDRVQLAKLNNVFYER
ncbi:TPA: glycosyltransferase [Vibrio vulnificus]